MNSSWIKRKREGTGRTRRYSQPGWKARHEEQVSSRQEARTFSETGNTQSGPSFFPSTNTTMKEPALTNFLCVYYSPQSLSLKEKVSNWPSIGHYVSKLDALGCWKESDGGRSHWASEVEHSLFDSPPNQGFKQWREVNIPKGNQRPLTRWRCMLGGQKCPHIVLIFLEWM